jgi:hypothetical protein
VRDGYVYAWRTAKSQHNGSTEYRPGIYTAVLSRDISSSCHPGIYFATQQWLAVHYPSESIVPVRVKLGHIVAAGDKFRTDELEVLGKPSAGS